jgi:hypothetical protein
MITKAHFVWLAFLGLILSLSGAEPPSNRERPTPPLNTGIQASADAALLDQFELQGIQASPARADGSYDWDYRGPKDDKEWAWFLNRQRYFEDLYVAYTQTGETRYVDKIFSILTDWISQNKTPPSGMSFSSAWRPLEAARRVLESWDLIYLKLWDDPRFPPALKSEFIEAFENHGDYLMDHHALYGNHLITEMLALLKLSLLLPEANNSEQWQEYALKQLDQEYHKQFYPEGAHKELSSHYQRVVVLNYQLLLTLLEMAGKEAQLKIWKPRVESMWAYFNAIQKPNGLAPLNNDSDVEDISKLLKQNQRIDWMPPNASSYFPNAGQVIFRSPNTSTDELWAFFRHWSTWKRSSA